MEVIRKPFEGEVEDVMGGSGRLEVQIHEHGLVALVDVMPRLVPKGKTADSAIVQAARVSYGEGTKQISEDRGLIRYLYGHRHTSPLEMVEFKFHQVMPVFVARQWIRHRTACLAGDVELTFDLPGGIERRGNQAHKLTVNDIWNRWQPTENKTRPDKQRNPYFKRDRVKGMMLRSLTINDNLCDRSVYHTRITDIWQNGEKPIIKVKFDNGREIRATRDHLCYTDCGWLKLGEAVDRGVRFASCSRNCGFDSEPVNIDEEIQHEQWRDVVHYENKYQVSNLGRVRSLYDFKGQLLSDPYVKGPTLFDDGYVGVSLSNSGTSSVRHVHTLVLEAFIGAPDGRECRHLNNNRQDNRLNNLCWGTAQDNSNDRMDGGHDQRLVTGWTKVIDWCDDGVEMTYDISVEGPYHNFLAGGIFVHNSVNEYSARYSIVKDRFFRPSMETIRQQSAVNKQGSDGTIDNLTASEFLEYLDIAEAQYERYEKLAAKGVAREIARIGLPLSMYTEWYWKIDLHNLIHFLGLRMDKHAQQEIRDYAYPIYELIKPIVPLTMEAFMDYHPNMDGMWLSRQEIESIKGTPFTGSGREQAEFKEKKMRLGLT